MTGLVKGSRSLDAGSNHSSDSSVNNKITNMKPAKDIHASGHAHSHSNSSITSSVIKKALGNEKDYTSQHAKTSLSGAPIFLDSKKPSNRFLRSLQQYQNGIPEPGRSKNWPYLGYMVNGLKNLILTFYFNWTMVFTAPISSAAFIIGYPTTVTFLVLFEIGLKLFLENWGGTQVVRYISLKFGQGKV